MPPKNDSTRAPKQNSHNLTFPNTGGAEPRIAYRPEGSPPGTPWTFVPLSGTVISATITVYDLAGKKVGFVAEGEYDTGIFQAHWSPENTANGVYLVRMQAISLQSERLFQSSRRILLLK